MTDHSTTIEALEHRYMRAWIAQDTALLKKLTSRNFRMVIGSKPCVMLDGASWLEAAKYRFSCRTYQFGDIYVHDLGSTAVFATQLQADLQLGDYTSLGQFWVVDLWRKGRIRRAWRIVDRSISRVEGDLQLPDAVRALQLWGKKRMPKLTNEKRDVRPAKERPSI